MSTAGAEVPSPGAALPDVVTLLDWRRRVHSLYAEVRALRPVDRLASHRRWCQARDELFAHHPQTPLDAPDAAALRQRLADGGPGLPVWNYDPTLALTAVLEADVQPRRFPVATSGGGTIEFVTCGAVTLPFGRLEVYWLDAYGGGLFLPFRDATAGTETYGGGRYLLDTSKGADLGLDPAATAGGPAGSSVRLVLDFNFAYSPSCSYGPAWSCPLAPPTNRLDVTIRGGEQVHRPT